MLSRKHSWSMSFLFGLKANSQGKKQFGLCGLLIYISGSGYIRIYIRKITHSNLVYCHLLIKFIWLSVSWGAWHLRNAGCMELKWDQSGGKHLIQNKHKKFLHKKTNLKGCFFLVIPLLCYKPYTRCHGSWSKVVRFSPSLGISSLLC